MESGVSSDMHSSSSVQIIDETSMVFKRPETIEISSDSLYNAVDTKILTGASSGSSDLIPPAQDPNISKTVPRTRLRTDEDSLDTSQSPDISSRIIEESPNFVPETLEAEAGMPYPHDEDIYNAETQPGYSIEERLSDHVQVSESPADDSLSPGGDTSLERVITKGGHQMATSEDQAAGNALSGSLEGADLQTPENEGEKQKYGSSGHTTSTTEPLASRPHQFSDSDELSAGTLGVGEKDDKKSALGRIEEALSYETEQELEALNWSASVGRPEWGHTRQLISMTKQLGGELAEGSDGYSSRSHGVKSIHGDSAIPSCSENTSGQENVYQHPDNGNLPAAGSNRAGVHTGSIDMEIAPAEEDNDEGFVQPQHQSSSAAGEASKEHDSGSISTNTNSPMERQEPLVGKGDGADPQDEGCLEPTKKAPKRAPRKTTDGRIAASKLSLRRTLAGESAPQERPNPIDVNSLVSQISDTCEKSPEAHIARTPRRSTTIQKRKLSEARSKDSRSRSGLPSSDKTKRAPSKLPRKKLTGDRRPTARHTKVLSKAMPTSALPDATRAGALLSPPDPFIRTSSEHDEHRNDDVPCSPKGVQLERARIRDVTFANATSHGEGPISQHQAAGEAEASISRMPALEVRPNLASGDTLLLNNSDSDIDLSYKQRTKYRITTRRVKVIVEKLTPTEEHVEKAVEVERPTQVATTSMITPSLQKALSPTKPSLSSGELADISSSVSAGDRYALSRRCGQANSTPRTIEERDMSLAIGQEGSQSLFSDLESVGAAGSNAHGGNGAALQVPETAIHQASTSAVQSPTSSRIKRPRVAPASVQPNVPSPVPEYDLPSTPDSQFRTDFPDGSPGVLRPGARVFAKWRDKNFYPGRVLDKDGLGRYKVRFVDEGVRVMPQTDVVPVTALKPGDVLMLCSETEDADAELQPIVINKVPETDHIPQWFSGHYEVDNRITGAPERVSWEKMLINKDQAAPFLSSLVNRSAQEIIPDNISENRTRLSRARHSPAVSSHTPTTSKRTAIRHLEHDSNVGDSERRTPPSESAQAKSTGKKRSPKGAPTRPDHSRSTTPISKSRLSKTKEHRRSIDLFSDKDCSVEASQLFSGLSFALTTANQGLVTSDVDTLRDIPFNRRRLRELIEARGGTILKDFSQIADASKCYLISDGYCRTHKYLSALAHAIPCVSHLWIHRSCDQNKMLPYKDFMLPAGYSLESGKEIEWHTRCPKLLKEKKILPYTTYVPSKAGAPDFVQIWSPLLRAMSATVLTDTPDEGNNMDVLVADISCPRSLIQLAQDHGAITVSSEWLIQSLITGAIPDATAHERYRWNYVEPPLDTADIRAK